jgi:putative DNA primase/helicase
MTLDPRAVARSVGGTVTGDNILAPGPGHSASDRSLSIKIDPGAPDGFILYSFAGDDVAACRDHVRSALGLKTAKRVNLKPQPSAALSAIGSVNHSSERIGFALQLWREARDPRGTLVTDYLSSRGLTLPDDVASDVIRFHPALTYDGGTTFGMVALFRDIRTNTPCGVHRTFLDARGCKLGRGMLGRAKQAAIKIDADENVTIGLIIGEGFETSLAARLAGFCPVWAAGSAGSITNFPVLAGAEALTILGEVGDGGVNHRASQTCAARWMAAGQEAFIVTPLVGDDLNDAWREVAR